jgi:hypothetical protein
MPPPGRRRPEAGGSYEAQALDALRVVDRQAQRDRTTERMADHRDAVEL